MPAETPLLVTGAAGGIRGGVSRMLSRRDHHVIVVDRDTASAERAAAGVGGGAVAVACGATDRTAVAALAARIRGEWADRLEVIVCNGGVIVPGDAAEASVDDLWMQVDVMLGSPIQFIAAAVDVVRAHGRGWILATVPMGGILALPGSATYSAAKSGLRAFLTALSAELAGTGVQVSGIYPSGVDAAMLRHEARHGGSMLNFVGQGLQRRRRRARL